MATFIHYIGYILIVLGVLWLVLGFRNLVTANASRSWKNAPGVVTKSYVRSSLSNEQNQTSHFYPDINYEFLVDGNKYEGDERYAGSSNESYSNSLAAEEILTKFPVGKPVTVYYNPQQPKNCVLTPGVNQQGKKQVTQGVLFLLAGLAAVAYHFLNIPQ